MSGYQNPEDGSQQQYPGAPPPAGGQRAPRRRRTLWLIAIPVALVALCCIAGAIVFAVSFSDSGDEVTPDDEAGAAGDTPAPEDEAAPEEEPGGPEVFQIGETGTYSEDGEEVGSVTVTAAERFTEPRTEFGDLPEHDEFVLVTINAEATGDDLYSLNPLDFHLRDADGRQYEYAGGASLFAVDETLDDVELNPGEQVTGDLIFDAPSEPLELVYAPNLSRGLAAWEIP